MLFGDGTDVEEDEDDKILIDQQLGGVVNDDHGSAMGQDYIYVGNKNLKRLSFRLTDQSSKTMNLYGIPF